METSQVTKMSLAELQALVLSLQARIEKLETPAPKAEPTEMTDDHARRIMTGDLKDKKHKDAAEALGLTYGQVYSCRLEYTFKHIHKELRSTAGYKNPWVK